MRVLASPSLIVTRPVTRFRVGTDVITELDAIASEYALTIYVNSQELATVVCTPNHMEELVIGFLASEGVLQSATQVRQLRIDEEVGTAYVEMEADISINQDFYNKRYIGSCCGKSRQSFYFVNDAHLVQPVSGQTVLDSHTILDLMDGMETEAGLFRATGGVHMACLCDKSTILLARTDIGRHNALDKLYGHVLKMGLPIADKVITFSGRLSSEVLLKVAKIGVDMVLAKSAPTAMAIDMAEELNITTVGFIRSGSFNVYTHPWRVNFAKP